MKSPQAIHDELARKTDLSPDQLRDLKEMPDFQKYGDAKSGGEDLNKPVDDMIRLLETPADEYEDTDDGFNEVEEANQALAFIDRMEEVEPGETTLDNRRVFDTDISNAPRDVEDSDAGE